MDLGVPSRTYPRAKFHPSASIFFPKIDHGRGIAQAFVRVLRSLADVALPKVGVMMFYDKSCSRDSRVKSFRDGKSRFFPDQTALPSARSPRVCLRRVLGRSLVQLAAPAWRFHRRSTRRSRLQSSSIDDFAIRTWHSHPTRHLWVTKLGKDSRERVIAK